MFLKSASGRREGWTAGPGEGLVSASTLEQKGYKKATQTVPGGGVKRECIDTTQNGIGLRRPFKEPLTETKGISSRNL